MTIVLVLQGRYQDGVLVSHGTVRRAMFVNTDDDEARGKIGRFRIEGGGDALGIGNESDGWWRVVESFECMEPEVELYEGKCHVAYSLSESELEDVLKDGIRPKGKD